jgi:hypothetical protein
VGTQHCRRTTTAPLRAAPRWPSPCRCSPSWRQAAAEEADDALESLLVLPLAGEALLDPESELAPSDPEELPDPPSDFAGGLFDPEA